MPEFVQEFRRGHNRATPDGHGPVAGDRGGARKRSQIMKSSVGNSISAIAMALLTSLTLADSRGAFAAQEPDSDDPAIKADLERLQGFWGLELVQAAENKRVFFVVRGNQ